MPGPAATKLDWQGTITAVQPRIRMTRSFDQRHHSYLGYALFVEGVVEGAARLFSLGVGPAAHEKHGFAPGDVVSGQALSVPDPELEPVEFYKVTRIRVAKPGASPKEEPPPWTGAPPSLATYRERGHRRLAAQTYASHCTRCLWGARMPVEMILDQWNPDRRSYRFETFCYGPKSCPRYRPGPARKVPGRKGMSWTEEDWVDEQDTAHREPGE